MKLYHPDLNVTIDVERESKAKILERSGWERTVVPKKTVIQGNFEHDPKMTSGITWKSNTDSEFVLEDEHGNNTEEV